MVILMATIAKIITTRTEEKLVVRISDARYDRDLRRYHLAWRLIQGGARTRKVQRWSGLSVYRVKTLFEGYVSASESRSPQRGVAPHQVSFFWRSAQLRSEAAVLAGFLEVYEVLPEARGAGVAATLESVTRGERLCRAYEEFKACWPAAQSTIEHAMLLLQELVRGVEIGLTVCPECDSLVVRDLLSITPPRCSFCQYEARAGRPYPSSVTLEAQDSVAGSEPAWQQGSLF